MKRFWMVGAAMMFACSVALAGQYRIGDEILLSESPQMPEAPPGLAWCLVRKSVNTTIPGTEFQMPVPAQFGKREVVERVMPEHRTGTVVPARFEQKPYVYTAVEAYEEWKVVPARFETVQERVMVCPEYVKLEVVPAQFRTEQKVITVKPATRSFLEIPCDDGNICWTTCDEPAKTRAIAVQVLVADATERPVTIQAQYQNVTVRKMVEGPRIEKVQHAAQQAQIVQNVVATPARVDWAAIPAKDQSITVEYETVPQGSRTQTTPPRTVREEVMVWRLQSANVYTPTSHVESEYGSVPGASRSPLGQDAATRSLAPRR